MYGMAKSEIRDNNSNIHSKTHGYVMQFLQNHVHILANSTD